MKPGGTKKQFVRLPTETEQAATALVDAAFAVHQELGPGLLESVYESCLAIELENRSVKVERQVAVPLIYKGTHVGDSLKLDMLVADSVVCELKAVQEMHPVYKAQLMSYLKLSGRRLGFLINFNVAKIKDGITRVIL